MSSPTAATAGAAKDPSIRRVVAFGGGHGMFASLRALRRLKLDEGPDQQLEITAIVTVADDGGSSGRLRRDFDMLPPGDLRQALVALAGEDRASAKTAALFQHRFSGDGELGGHAVGNLVLAGLVEITGSPVAALSQAGKILHTCGRVLPMSAQPLVIEADVRGVNPAAPDEVSVVRGQVAVATTDGVVEEVRVVPPDPEALPEALAAIAEADWLIFGPGSWFTSVLPHLLVPQLRKAIANSAASRLVILNLTSETETSGLTAADLLVTLRQHAPEFHADVVLADPGVARPAFTESDSVPVAQTRPKATGPGIALPLAAMPGSPAATMNRVPAATMSRTTPGKTAQPKSPVAVGDDIDPTETDPQLHGAAESLGARLMVASVAHSDGSARHAPAELAAALRAVFDGG